MTIKKAYFFSPPGSYSEPYGPFDTIEQMFEVLRVDFDPDEYKKGKFYEAVEGTYVPPSSPETVVFPTDVKKKR